MNLLRLSSPWRQSVPALFFAADPDNGLVFEYSASSPVDSVSNGIVDLTGADDDSTYKQAANRAALNLQNRGSSANEPIEVVDEEL